MYHEADAYTLSVKNRLVITRWGTTSGTKKATTKKLDTHKHVRHHEQKRLSGPKLGTVALRKNGMIWEAKLYWENRHKEDRALCGSWFI